MSTKRTHDGWELREAGPANAAHTVLMLPGGLCSAEFYEDLLAEPKLASFHLIAATVPGFGRTTPPDDVTMENYAHLVGKLAADVGCDVLVGHSMGANVALEAAALGTFSGPVALLSPSFSREDEFKVLSVLDKIGRVPGLGRLIWSLGIKGAASDVKKRGPEARREALAADMANNDAGFCRRSVHEYFAYLDRYGTLVDRLCTSGAKAWVVFGENDEVKLQDEERRGLQACPSVTMVTVPDGTHMFLVEQPAHTADVIAVAAASLDA